MNINATPIYRQYLEQALAGRAGMNKGQVQELIGRYDEMNAHASAETSFKVFMEAYGNEDTATACRTVSATIQKALESNKQTVDVNPRTRLRAAIEKLNKNIDKCAIEYNGKSLTKEEIEQVHVSIPNCLKPRPFETSYTATAKIKDGNGRINNLGLSFTIFR